MLHSTTLAVQRPAFRWFVTDPGLAGRGVAPGCPTATGTGGPVGAVEVSGTGVEGGLMREHPYPFQATRARTSFCNCSSDTVQSSQSFSRKYTTVRMVPRMV